MNRRNTRYSKVTVERPLCDENDASILKKGKPQPNGNKRDTDVQIGRNFRAFGGKEQRRKINEGAVWGMSGGKGLGTIKYNSVDNASSNSQKEKYLSFYRYYFERGKIIAITLETLDYLTTHEQDYYNIVTISLHL